MRPTSIRLAVPFVSPRAKLDVATCLDGPQLSRGPVANRFEKEFGDRHGRIAIATSSGTAALHAALWAAGVRHGDLVLCPTLTYAGTLNAITACGARAVLIDVDPVSWGLSRLIVQNALAYFNSPHTRRVAAIVQVHLYGVAENIGQFGLPRPVIEDAAEALFAVTPDGQMAGTMGDAAIFSFFGNKVLATG